MSNKSQKYPTKIFSALIRQNMRKFWVDTFDPQLTYSVKIPLEQP